MALNEPCMGTLLVNWPSSKVRPISEIFLTLFPLFSIATKLQLRFFPGITSTIAHLLKHLIICSIYLTFKKYLNLGWSHSKSDPHIWKVFVMNKVSQNDGKTENQKKKITGSSCQKLNSEYIFFNFLKLKQNQIKLKNHMKFGYEICFCSSL